MKKMLLLFTIVLILLSACAPQAPQPQPTAELPTAAPAATPTPNLTPEVASFTVIDALDREVFFESPPQRIVLAGRAVLLIADGVYLFPQAAERLAAIGKASQTGGDFLALVDPDYHRKNILESEAGPEQIAPLNPDLVILKSYMAESLGGPLETLGIPVVYVDLETPDQYQRDLTTLGQVFQDEARAQELIAYYRERVDWISAGSAGLDDAQRPRVLLLYYTDRDGETAFNVPPLGWMQTILIELSGGAPVWRAAQLGNGWTKVGFEQIAAWDADQIYIVAYFNDVEEVVENLKADPQWQVLRAVAEGKLYAFPTDAVSWDQPDPRWVLGLIWLAQHIHPARFSEVDMRQEMRMFFEKLYRLDTETYETKVLPQIKGEIP